eukprot:IDg11273t1
MRVFLKSPMVKSQLSSIFSMRRKLIVASRAFVAVFRMRALMRGQSFTRNLSKVGSIRAVNMGAAAEEKGESEKKSSASSRSGVAGSGSEKRSGSTKSGGGCPDVSVSKNKTSKNKTAVTDAALVIKLSVLTKAVTINLKRQKCAFGERKCNERVMKVSSGALYDTRDKSTAIVSKRSVKMEHAIYLYSRPTVARENCSDERRGLNLCSSQLGATVPHMVGDQGISHSEAIMLEAGDREKHYPTRGAMEIRRFESSLSSLFSTQSVAPLCVFV